MPVAKKLDICAGLICGDTRGIGRLGGNSAPVGFGAIAYSDETPPVSDKHVPLHEFAVREVACLTAHVKIIALL